MDRRAIIFLIFPLLAGGIQAAAAPSGVSPDRGTLSDLALATSVGIPSLPSSGVSASCLESDGTPGGERTPSIPVRRRDKDGQHYFHPLRGWRRPISGLQGRAADPPRLSQAQRVNLAWQIALAAHYFSPGLLDGIFGPRSRTALREYTASHVPGANPFNPHDPRVYQALGVNVADAITRYTISAQDRQAVGRLHHHWLNMASASRMPYASLADCLSEKFHCTKRLLQQLNPRRNWKDLRIGQTIYVPNIRPFPGPDDFGVPGGLSAVLRQDRLRASRPRVAYLDINLRRKIIRAYDRHGNEVAFFYCSIPAHKADYPRRNTHITDIALNPNYTFLPEMYPEAHLDQPLLIPPGPRNPVGIVWMGLGLPGVGIHGNPYPQYIGITGSHGCFRMTNWDAVELLSLVHIGTPVYFTPRPGAARPAPRRDDAAAGRR